MTAIFIPITPVSKPRQTKRDRWAKRPCVVKYRAFADELRRQVEEKYPGGIAQFRREVEATGLAAMFHISPPKSWNQKKRLAHFGEPHRGTKDVDNLLKSVMDALFEQDCVVWRVFSAKMWATEEGITISPISP